ncbi:hypothetical protein GPECTOR_4g950 [Gonium pectorale]|uniref:Exonuclease domain-containing protein n=1 Tax=Gonium pectorale TaxID=33097 RepID=A0A150GYX4_GONPE|nr:hypothetical protein GPECTOR_4g950 [Gonium pectorale]|eukprot:KXZ54878.1 hypothetical protein GPECTOR_4g950 [Gonium pectorale]
MEKLSFVIHENPNGTVTVAIPDGMCFLTCGHWDLRTQLPRELAAKRLPLRSRAYSRYINIKDDFSSFYGTRARGMTCMLAHLGLSLEGRHHCGLDDCRNIGRVFARMVADGCREFAVHEPSSPHSLAAAAAHPT